jgi:hypothetical protein
MKKFLSYIINVKKMNNEIELLDILDDIKFFNYFIEKYLDNEDGNSIFVINQYRTTRRVLIGKFNELLNEKR